MTLVSEEKVTMNPLKARVVAVSKDGRSGKVEVPTVVTHEKYGKRLHRVISLHVDTGRKDIKVGSMVNILPSRRISRTKSWKVVSVIE